MVTTEQGYRAQAYTFLEQAHKELEDDDLPQASEKGWGAAAQMVKAIAERRGLAHHTHAHLWAVVNSLANDRFDSEFGLAHNLHINFYEGSLARRQVNHYLTAVAALVATLDVDVLGNTPTNGQPA